MLIFVLLALGAFRITRLLVLDSIIDAQRTYLQCKIIGDKDPVPPRREKLYDLTTCSWCVGWWVSGAFVLAFEILVGLPTPLLWWPAVAGAAQLAWTYAED